MDERNGLDGLPEAIEAYENRVLVHVRYFFADGSGRLLPTKRGVCVNVRRIDDLFKAIRKARDKAIELGLLDADDAS